MISVQHVDKTFGKQQVLFDITADFQPGKINLIIGQSGQGKTVLAKSMVGLHEVDQGQILDIVCGTSSLGWLNEKRSGVFPSVFQA